MLRFLLIVPLIQDVCLRRTYSVANYGNLHSLYFHWRRQVNLLKCRDDFCILPKHLNQRHHVYITYVHQIFIFIFFQHTMCQPTLEVCVWRVIGLILHVIHFNSNFMFSTWCSSFICFLWSVTIHVCYPWSLSVRPLLKISICETCDPRLAI